MTTSERVPERRCQVDGEHDPHLWPSPGGWTRCLGTGSPREAIDDQPTSHRARPATSLLGCDLIEALVAEGTCPADTRRVVIDASVDTMTVMYVETEATRGLLDVLRATSRAAVRVHQEPTRQGHVEQAPPWSEERPADPPAEQPTAEQPAQQKGTEDR